MENSQDSELGPDAGVPLPDAEPEPEPLTLSQNESDAIIAENSIACTRRNSDGDPTNFHTENSYYRVFAADALPSDFAALSVTVGVQEAQAPAGSQPVEVKLHALTSDAFLVANLEELAAAEATVTNQNLSTLEVAFKAPVEIPAGATLVVEVWVPDSGDADNVFFIGANAAGQTGPSYIRAPACDTPEPTDVADIGFADVHLVLQVNGQAL